MATGVTGTQPYSSTSPYTVYGTSPQNVTYVTPGTQTQYVTSTGYVPTTTGYTTGTYGGTTGTYTTTGVIGGTTGATYVSGGSRVHQKVTAE